jgi:F0F1-type ATP synthase assembly protein I
MHKAFEFITELIGWIQIVLSPTLIGMLLGLIFYGNFQNQTGMIIGFLLVGIGFVIGIIWATRKFKTTGTINFLSKISSTPDLDKKQ